MNIRTKRLTLNKFTPRAKELLEMAIKNAKDGKYTYVGIIHFEQALDTLKEKHCWD